MGRKGKPIGPSPASATSTSLTPTPSTSTCAGGAGVGAGAGSKSDRWKYLAIQREKVALRREVVELKQAMEQSSQSEADVHTRLTAVDRDRERALEELHALKDSHEQHTVELEEKIQELTHAVMILRRKGGTLILLNCL